MNKLLRRNSTFQIEAGACPGVPSERIVEGNKNLWNNPIILKPNLAVLRRQRVLFPEFECVTIRYKIP